MTQIVFKPIGVIHSPHLEPQKTPIQPVYAKGIKGKIEIHPEYVVGLKDLDGFSHIYLIYHFNRAEETKLLVKPYLDDVERGVFAARTPFRPNKIGISIVRLTKIEENFLYVEDIDILDKTPLLDIKPYTAKFDVMDVIKSGWQDDIDDLTAHKIGSRQVPL